MLNDYYARRGRMGFGTIKPFQMNMPEIRPQEEDDTLSSIGGILSGLPGVIQGMKGGKATKTQEYTPVTQRQKDIEESGIIHDDWGSPRGRIDPAPMPYEVPRERVPMPIEPSPSPVPMPFEVPPKRIGAPPMPFEIAKRLPNFAGFLARGGKVKKNQFAIVGENGPEVVNNNNGEVSVEPVQLGQVGDLTQRGMSPMPSQATEPAFEPGGYATYRKPVPEDLTQYEQPMEAMSGLENAKFDYETALKSKPGKEKWWKDALVKTAQVVSNMFNPQNQVKVQGYGAMKRDKMIQDAYGRYKPLQDAEDKRIADVYKRKQIENVDVDNQRQQMEVERKAKADAARNKYYEGLLEDKAKGRELQETQVEDLKRYRDWLIQSGDEKNIQTARRIDETIRNNKVNNGLRERQVSAMETRAKLAADKAKSSAPQGKRSGKLTDAQIIKIATGIDDDFNNGRIDEATYNARINLMLEGINGRNK